MVDVLLPQSVRKIPGGAGVIFRALRSGRGEPYGRRANGTALVTSVFHRYRSRMSLRAPVAAILFVAFFANSGTADTLQLKEGSSIRGKILAEKTDQVVVDVGYTVLVVPRHHVVEIVRGEAEEGLPVPAQLDSQGQGVGTSQALYRTSNGGGSERSVRELVGTLGESVVQVRTLGGLGSGFFIHEDGFLITNFHVIEGETQISVEVYHQAAGQLERRNYREIRIVALNKFADLALLKVEDKDAARFKPVVLGNQDEMAVGDRVFAIGSPLGLERTVTEGILSTKTRLIGGGLYLQTNAQINPGNSGGPLFNLRGEVVGVTTLKITFGEGLGFAITAETVKHFLRNRDAFAYDNDNPSTPYRYLEPPGRLRRGAAAE